MSSVEALTEVAASVGNRAAVRTLSNSCHCERRPETIAVVCARQVYGGSANAASAAPRARGHDAEREARPHYGQCLPVGSRSSFPPSRHCRDQ
jgi:hypothetical protein